MKVSVITPVYNVVDDFYYRTDESLDRQTSRDFEWILVDDGSKKNDLIYFPDIRLENNYGPSVARNIGFQISSGDIITYLDMGDIMHPKRIENLIKIFTENDIELLFSAYVINPPNQIFNHLNWIGSSSFPTSEDYIKLLQTQNISIPMGVAHTRKPFVEVGGFQRGIVCGEDGITWRRMADYLPHNKIIFSNDIAGTYNINPVGQSRTQRRFEMGGFAFDGSKHDNGKYLDKDWFSTYSSKGYYE